MAINVKWNPQSYLATDVVKVRPTDKNAAGVAIAGSVVAQTTADAGSLNIPQTGYLFGQEFLLTVERDGVIIAQNGIYYRESKKLPGGDNIAAGDEQLGFYGVVNNDLLGIAPALAKRLNTTNYYQKLAHKGRVIYVPFYLNSARPSNANTVTMREIWEGGYAKKATTPSWTTDEAYDTSYRDIGDGLRSRIRFIHHKDNTNGIDMDNEVFQAFRPAFVNTTALDPTNANYLCLPTRRNDGSATTNVEYRRADVRTDGFYYDTGAVTTDLTPTAATMAKMANTTTASALVSIRFLPSFWYIEIYKA